MKILNLSTILVLMICISCKNNANLYGQGSNQVDAVTSVEPTKPAEPTTPVEPEPEPRVINLESTSSFSINDGETYGSWVTQVVLEREDDPSIRAVTRITKRDPATDEILFSGLFELGADLSTAIPTEVSGDLDWSRDFAPYYAPGSKLADGGVIVFDKQKWAKDLSLRDDSKNYYQHVIDEKDGKAIEVETIYQVVENDEVVAQTKTLEGVKYHYSMDNDVVSSGGNKVVSSDGYSFNETLDVGGPTFVGQNYIDMKGDFVTEPSHKNCDTVRLAAIRGLLTELRAVKTLDGNWVEQNVSVSGGFNALVKKVFGAKSFSLGEYSTYLHDWEAPVVDCEERVQYYHITSAVEKSAVTDIRIQSILDVANPGDRSNMIEVFFAQYESY